MNSILPLPPPPFLFTRPGFNAFPAPAIPVTITVPVPVTLLLHTPLSTGRRGNISWKKPPPGIVKMNTDASYKYDSSKASITGVCRDEIGNWLFGFSSRVKSDSAFEAELLAVREALKLCWDNGLKAVIVESDSETVVHRIHNQIIEEPKNKIEAVILECQRYGNQDWHCLIQHSLREGNFAADALTKIEITESFDLHVWIHPPKSLSLGLQADRMGMGVPRHGSLDKKKLRYLEVLQRELSIGNQQY